MKIAARIQRAARQYQCRVAELVSPAATSGMVATRTRIAIARNSISTANPIESGRIATMAISASATGLTPFTAVVASPSLDTAPPTSSTWAACWSTRVVSPSAAERVTATTVTVTAIATP